MEVATNPIFHPIKPTKILYSPGTGAGWVTWAPRAASEAFLVWMLTYEPLIEGLERRYSHEHLEDILTQFHHNAKAKFGIDRIITARIGDLFVEEVGCVSEMRETEGRERIWDVSRRKEILLLPHVLPVVSESGKGNGSGNGGSVGPAAAASASRDGAAAAAAISGSGGAGAVVKTGK